MASSDTLREQVYARIAQARDDAYMDCRGMVPFRAAMMPAVDDVILRVLAAIAEQVEALPHLGNYDAEGHRWGYYRSSDVQAVLARLGGKVPDGE